MAEAIRILFGWLWLLSYVFRPIPKDWGGAYGPVILVIMFFRALIWGAVISFLVYFFVERYTSN